MNCQYVCSDIPLGQMLQLPFRLAAKPHLLSIVYYIPILSKTTDVLQGSDCAPLGG